MDFLNTLDENDKMLVEVIIEEDNFNLEEKLRMLKDAQIGDDVYEKVKEFLTKEVEKEEPNTTDFISLMQKTKKGVANLLLEHEKFSTLDSLISKQSEECKKAYEEFKKQREVKEEEKKENVPVVKILAPEKEEKAVPNILDSTDEEISDEDMETEEEPQWIPNVTPEFFDQFPQCLNILVLGETGVGKSTFINGLANYLKYGNMHEAKKHGVEILIRSSFIHMDEDYNKMRVECDPTIEIEDENENTADGQSSTQSPKAYQFEWGPTDNRKKIRIIDTPGVGDVRGLEQEQMNFAKILSFIADYPEIHAILILMKPNNARLTVTYRYCINELLTHLHVSASKNILFCFTNARQTLYKPGDTMPALESHLEELYKSRGVRIPLQNDTVFCFDNESFRFLCAWKQGATFEDKDIENFDKSWKTTVDETFRLFKKISQLPTHKTEETLSVNNIRSVILAMARPLAEVAKNQMVNAQLINEKVKEVEDLVRQGKSLGNAQLYVDQVVITPKEIDYPITVCTNERCVEIVKLNGTVHETYYKQKCHLHCFLTGVQTGIVPNPQLQGCACFRTYGIQQCDVCGCDWTTHLHIRYELVKTMQKIIDPTVQDSIKNCDDKIYTTELFIETEKKRKAVLEGEANKIRSHCADFAAFLKKNSIIPYNDVYKEYVEHLIREENGKVSHGASNRMLLQLQKYRDEYEQQVKILESHGTASTSNKDIHQINEMLDELKRMKNCGGLLQEIEKLEMLSVRKEQTNRITNVNIKKGWMNGLYEGVSSFFKKSKKTKKGRKSAVKFQF